MAEGSRNVAIGTIGGTPINADMRRLGHDAPVKVHLTATYVRQPLPGQPIPPEMTGVAASRFTNTFQSGTTIALHKPEADAIVTAGGGTYA